MFSIDRLAPRAKCYLFLVENEWIDGRLVQRVLHRFGRLERIACVGLLDTLVQSLGRFAEKYRRLGCACEGRHDSIRATSSRSNTEIIRRVETEAQPSRPPPRRSTFRGRRSKRHSGRVSRAGLAGLLPRKRGPRGGHKLAAGIVAFLQELRDTEPSLGAAELPRRVAQRFATTVHPRSIERALARPEIERRR
jgi:hypothetical protein